MHEAELDNPRIAHWTASPAHSNLAFLVASVVQPMTGIVGVTHEIA
jgi:hypothetical protein